MSGGGKWVVSYVTFPWEVADPGFSRRGVPTPKSAIISSIGSSGRVGGGQETWNLWGHLWRPSFLWLISTGRGGGVLAWPPRHPPGPATGGPLRLGLALTSGKSWISHHTFNKCAKRKNFWNFCMVIQCEKGLLCKNQLKCNRHVHSHEYYNDIRLTLILVTHVCWWFHSLSTYVSCLQFIICFSLVLSWF